MRDDAGELPLRWSKGTWANAGSSLRHLLAFALEEGLHDAALQASLLLKSTEPAEAGAVEGAVRELAERDGLLPGSLE